MYCVITTPPLPPPLTQPPHPHTHQNLLHPPPNCSYVPKQRRHHHAHGLASVKPASPIWVGVISLWHFHGPLRNSSSSSSSSSGGTNHTRFYQNLLPPYRTHTKKQKKGSNTRSAGVLSILPSLEPYGTYRVRVLLFASVSRLSPSFLIQKIRSFEM